MSLTARQREIRAGRIGGSDAAALFGVSPWRTPLRLYCEKVWDLAGDPERRDMVERLFDAEHHEMDPATRAARERGVDSVLARWTHEGRFPDDADDNWIVQSGEVAEGLLARTFARRHGVKVVRSLETVVSVERPWMSGTVDMRVLGRPRTVLECKRVTRLAPASRNFHGHIPDAYMIQAIHYLALHMGQGARSARGRLYGPLDECVFVLDDRDAYRDGWIEPELVQAFDKDTAAALAERERRFVEDHILAREPPPLSTVADASLGAIPAAAGTGRTLAEAELEVVQAFIRANSARLSAVKVEADLKTAVMELMGACEEVGREVGRPWVTWRKSKDRVVENWKKRALEAKGKLDLIATAIRNEPDAAAIAAIERIAREAGDSWQETVAPGPRVLRVAAAGAKWLREDSGGGNDD